MIRNVAYTHLDKEPDENLWKSYSLVIHEDY